MADNDRALYVCVNIGFTDNAVLARGLSTPFNVGFSENEVLGRGLCAPFNVGVEELAVEARALYSPLAVHDFTDQNDGIEIQLIATDIHTVEHNLAVK